MLTNTFLKQILITISAIVCISSFITTGSIQAFTGTSILFLINSITSIIEKEEQIGGKLFKFSSIFVKIEVVLSSLLFIIFTNPNNMIFIKSNNDTITFWLKVLVSVVVVLSVVTLSLIIGSRDNDEEVKSIGDAKQVIRESNDNFLEKSEERKTHYVLKKKEFITKKSHMPSKNTRKK